MDLSRWIPMRWPCGPLEIERGERREGFSSREREALERWGDPSLLERLDGTPVNCLVVSWAGGSAVDERQQQSLGPLLAAARERGLAVVGHVSPEADLRRAAEAARSAGLQALATESEEPVDSLPVLRFRERRLGEPSADGFLGVSGAPWPGLKVASRNDFDAWSGVTGPPWVDSNAWYVRLARELMDPRATWLWFDPPTRRMALPAGPYVQAIADAEIHGGRWVIALDPRLRYDLAHERQQAMETWARIVAALEFYGERQAWVGYRPVGRLGVVSDFAGANEFLSLEVVNLLSRQSSAYHILEKSRALAAPLDELKAVLYVDETPPDPDLVRRLYSFAEAGGTLIVPPGWEGRGEKVAGLVFPRFQVTRYGQGRLAVAREEIADPHLLAADAQVLMSHRYDPVRVFNPGTARFHYSASEDGRAGIVHLFRYGRRPFETKVSVWFRKPWASAAAWLVDGEGVRRADRSPRDPGVEFELPPVSVYCAVEVSA